MYSRRFGGLVAKTNAPNRNPRSMLHGQEVAEKVENPTETARGRSRVMRHEAERSSITKHEAVSNIDMHQYCSLLQ
jgi:hypothetical protein